MIEQLLHSYLGGEVFTAFDTETTGLSSKYEKIIEIGAVKFDKNGIIDTYSVLINPEKTISSEITRITGITNEMVSDCKTFSEITPSFLNFINETKLVAHNAKFDIGFVNAELEKTPYNNLRKSQCNAVDTVKVAQKVFPALPCYKLQELAKHFNIKVDAAHRAYDDARVCMELFVICMKQAASTIGTSLQLGF
ncbi:MAG: 3'-5' exonuclease [Treponemataceae bacterium]|nr:3'-5' exonuclease [Treponemataceae bacterium]